MILILGRSAFHRAIKSGRLTDRNELERANMLADRTISVLPGHSRTVTGAFQGIDMSLTYGRAP